MFPFGRIKLDILKTSFCPTSLILAFNEMNVISHIRITHEIQLLIYLEYRSVIGYDTIFLRYFPVNCDWSTKHVVNIIREIYLKH